MKIKAIETEYKGYKFRSRLEARWAVFFDEMNILWEYEKEGYELENGDKYLPDFWIYFDKTKECFNGIGYFIEIKAQEPTEKEREKLLLLSKIMELPTCCFYNLNYKSFSMASYYMGKCKIYNGIYDPEWIGITGPTDKKDMFQFEYLPFGYNFLSMPDRININKISDSLKKAMSARFEYKTKDDTNG